MAHNIYRESMVNIRQKILIENDINDNPYYFFTLLKFEKSL
jgi:hypothetical protein